MGILLTILKVIGIILAAIIGLVLLIILALLFVAFSYRVDGAYGPDINVKARVAWLWRLVCVSVRYTSELDFKIYLFGIPIITKARMDRKKARKAEKENNTEALSDEATTDTTNEASDTNETSDNNESIDTKETAESKETVEIKESIDATESQEESDKDKKNIIENVKEKADTTKKKVDGVVEKVTGIKNKVTSIATDEDIKSFVKKVLTLVIKLLKKLLIPKKHFVYVHYGSDDPGSTGQIAGYVAMAQAVLPLNIVFVPEFEGEALEVKGYIYGKIRLISIVIPALQIYFDKRLKKLLKKIKS